MNDASYVIALYIRLSIEDSKVDSMSIENQKIVLHQYVDTMKDVKNVEVLEFVDNGYSGTNFERPAVTRLLDMVREGKINCIIVKNFSRFGRNRISAGYFLDKVFPLYGVRFISLNEDFDSGKLNGDTGGLSVMFQYFQAEFYSRDLSVKYKSAKQVKFRRGEYQSKVCPYGYRKGADGRMEPDGEAAANVRLIFELARNGLSRKGIVRALFERGIPTPAEYKAAHGFTGHDNSRTRGVWHESTVTHILEDERYTGTYIMGKREVTEVGGHRVRMKDESQWVKIPDHHPAIIGKELFEQVQARLCRAPAPKKNVHTYPLRQKVFCGCCLHALSRTSNKNHTYLCRHTQVDESAPCHGLRISEAELEHIVYEMVLERAQAVPDSVPAAVPDSPEGRIADCQERKRWLYERFVREEISIEDYKEQKNALDDELDQLRQALAVIRTQAARSQTERDRGALLQKAKDAGQLTVELADILIDRVYVYPGGRVEPAWKTDVLSA